jgi:Ribbon-helix-helix protein, copG family
MKNNLRRLQIDLSEKAYARLEWLREETDAMSLTEVIREALLLREAVVRLRQEGKDIFAEDRRTKDRERLILP